MTSKDLKRLLKLSLIVPINHHETLIELIENGMTIDQVECFYDFKTEDCVTNK